MVQHSVSTTNFIFWWAGRLWHISEIMFLLTAPQELYTVFFCEQLMLTKFDVSRKETQTEIWSDSRAVKKMSQCVLLVFTSLPTLWFILNYLCHLVAAAGFQNEGGKEETNSKIILYQQCLQRKMGEWKNPAIGNVFPWFVCKCWPEKKYNWYTDYCPQNCQNNVFKSPGCVNSHIFCVASFFAQKHNKWVL